jgi:hypothetical protein
MMIWERETVLSLFQFAPFLHSFKKERRKKKDKHKLKLNYRIVYLRLIKRLKNLTEKLKR